MRLGGGFVRRWAAIGGRGRRWTAAGGAVALAAAGGLAYGVAASDGRAVASSEQWISVVDGPRDDQQVRLDTAFYRPAGSGRSPAILLGHGFGGTKDDMRAEARRLARDGYAVLTWSARGFGRSTGQIALNSPDYEVKDVRQLVDWLARRPEVRLDGPGDPRVGMTGESYGGAIALMTAGFDRRVDAIAPRITWYSLPDVFFPNATGRGPGAGVFKKLWAGLFFTSGADGSACGRFLPALCTMYQQVAESGRPTPEALSLLARSSPMVVATRIRVPSLLIQGQSDSLFPLDQADANARAIAHNDSPVRTVWYQGGHDGGDPETSRLEGYVRTWFDTYLKSNTPTATAKGPKPPPTQGGGATGDGFTVTRAGGIDSSSQRVVVRAASTGTYPGLSANPRTLPLRGAAQTVQNPAGGTPASISALPGLGGLDALGSLGGQVMGGGSGDDGAGGGNDGGRGGTGSRGGSGGGGGFTLDVPGQSAVFDTPALTGAVQLTGAASLRLKVTNVPSDGASLFAKLYDVAPGGGATPARRLAAPFHVSSSDDVTVTLPALDYRFEAGHRIRVVVSTTDMGFATPPKPASYTVAATSGITVPSVPSLRTPAAPLPAWVWALPVAAAAIAAGILLTGRRKPILPAPATGSEPRTAKPAKAQAKATATITAPQPDETTKPTKTPSATSTGNGSHPNEGNPAPDAQADGNSPARRGAQTDKVGAGSGASAGANGSKALTDGPERRPAKAAFDPGLADVPLEISGLTKAYSNGYRAVSELSFRVERGQVLGLLGPNGAGKTTTLRMLMGLIHPDEGEIRIFGHRVTPGAPVLSRLGSFVEGPGFLPHLSGRDNLDLYWRATGRPAGSAHLEEALEIADLGAALDRAVRTYSQGMRQRLAIAQAMLGLPDLLVLDEPTNGLDPPQIREMREVLVRYAASGRTVIVSSHLLAEVEQSCTHAVVMAGGRRVAAGPVSEITGTGRRLEDAFLEIIGEGS
ncbi:alpha/beta fold hydrolase [Actinomadura oligospora]|uniref:alpha/beta fold hydrolase n=1 Tax=Actinomadura oligospora TaxID=111804 RepID=UPI000689176D|nr:alpha/beta fold hydrolase [Actinomadura oligospora]